MFQLTTLLTLLTLLLSVKAEVDVPFYTHDQLANTACGSYISSSATFCASHGGRGLAATCLCKNPQALGTMAECYMQLGNKTSQINWFLSNCEKQANVTLTLQEFYAAYDNATNYFIDTKTTEGFNRSVIIYSPILLNQSQSQLYFDTNVGRFMNYNTAHYFGTIMLAYWGVVMVFAGFFNWTLYFFPSISNNAVIKKYRQYLSLPAVHRTHSSDGSFIKLFHYLIPNRLDTVLITIWWALCTAFQAGRYKMVFPNATWTSKEAMVGRLIADRSGITSLYCFPLLILLAGRNNFLNFITRWKYSRMIAIHRWVARATVIIIFIHTVSMSASGVGIGRFFSRNQQAYVQWGWVAIVCGTIIMVQACRYLRRKSYEFFYITHLLMAVFFTAGGWIHCEENGYGAWYYSAVAIWCFDRVIRIARCCAFGAPLATVELKAEETLRITIPKPSYWKPLPGQHAFVYFFRPTCWWQSHPFTIVQPNIEENKIRFYVKIKGGATHGLYKYLSKQPNKTAKIRVSVEGPYAAPASLQRFKNVFLIAGGNGIPGMFAEAMELVRRNNENQSVQLHWAIRHWKSLDWFAEELKQFENTKVSPIVYVSNPTDISGLESFSDSEASETNSETEEKGSSNEKTSSTSSESNVSKIREYLPHVTFIEGRPDITSLVKEAIAETNGSLAIVACAHPAAIDDARAAVVHNMSSTKHLVEFIDEMQVW